MELDCKSLQILIFYEGKLQINKISYKFLFVDKTIQDVYRLNIKILKYVQT